MRGETLSNRAITCVSRGMVVLLAAVVGVLLMPSVAGQSAAEKWTCGGLRAGIQAQQVHRDPGYTHPAYIMLHFILLNDGETTVNSAGEGWKIVVDGKEISDSDFIFGNGPGPIGGWNTLKPGEWFDFGKSLDIGKYFTEEREYRVSWKGARFQSPTITVKVSAEK